MLKTRLNKKEPCFGVFSSINSAMALEQLAIAGYDFVILDTEHTLLSGNQLETLLLAARVRKLPVLVRVSSINSPLIYPALDLGALGIVFSCVETKKQAERAVELTRHSPLGFRGLNATFHSDFGNQSLVDAMRCQDQSVLTVVMIETIRGVENSDEILSVEGVDMVLEGAADLSQSLGLSWQTTHKRVVDAVSSIALAAKHHDTHFCAIPRTAEQFEHWRSQGIYAFVLGDDRSIYRRAHHQHLRQHHDKCLS